jgi:thiol-disulfide isomerase/thioredoxin
MLRRLTSDKESKIIMNKRTLAILTVLSLVLLGGGAYATKALLDKPNEVPTAKAESSAKLADGAQAQSDTPAENLLSDSSSKVEEVDLTQVGGKYIKYDEFKTDREKYRKVKVALFFNAGWCPTCQALNKNINSELSQIPKNTVIVSVDYDQYIDLKKTYGVTYQHTIVQIDAEDKQIKKYAGSPDLLSVLAELQ